jgi:phage protein D
MVGGQNVTARLNPYLISVQVVDSFEGSMDKCSMELDDRNAQLVIPPDGEAIMVALGWANEGPNLPGKLVDLPSGRELKEYEWGGPGMQMVFSGTVTSAESGFSRRGGGRRLWIEAESADSRGAGKEVQHETHGEGQQDDSAAPSQTSGSSGGGTGAGGGAGGAGQIPFMKVAESVFGKAGLKVKMSPSMMKIARDFWHVKESPHHFGQHMAKELGGLFKVANGTAIFLKAGEGLNADGQTLAVVDAEWEVNLIAWRIKPFVGRPQYSEAAATTFDLHNASFNIIKAAIGGTKPFGRAKAIAHQINQVANQTNAEQQNQGSTADSQSGRGTGWALINGDPRCAAGSMMRVIGARPGVDGTYEMTEVEHNYTRAGYTTRATLKNPKLDRGDYNTWPDDPGAGTPVSEPPAAPAPEPGSTPQEIDSGLTFPDESTPPPIQIPPGGVNT